MTLIKKKRALLTLVYALAVPVASPAEASDDMFGAMFRMMLVMMNTMSDAMLENNNDSGWGGGDSFGLGMKDDKDNLFYLGNYGSFIETLNGM